MSLNALPGTDDGEAMRIRALVKDQVMLTLLYSGSNHSFVSEQFLLRVGIFPVPAPPKQVKVSNGEVMISDKCVLQLTWWCSGFTLHTDMRVLDLSAYDAILGYDWLKTHSPMQCYWDKQIVEFSEQGKLIRLQGVQNVGPKVQEVYAKKVVDLYNGNDIWALVLMTQESSTVDT